MIAFEVQREKTPEVLRKPRDLRRFREAILKAAGLPGGTQPRGR